MSAQENLNPQQFYHGTDYDLAPGAELRPENVPEDRRRAGISEHVWATSNPSDALDFATINHDVRRAYRVTPLANDVEPDGTERVKSKTGFRVVDRAPGSK